MPLIAIVAAFIAGWYLALPLWANVALMAAGVLALIWDGVLAYAGREMP